MVGQGALEFVAAAPQHADPLPAQATGELLDQASLPHPCLTTDERHSPLSCFRPVPTVLQERKFLLSTYQTAGWHHIEGIASSPHRGFKSWHLKYNSLSHALNRELPLQDILVELGGLHHRFRTQLLLHDLPATAVLLQRRVALPQPAVGAHRQPVRVLPQRIPVEQAEGRGQPRFIFAPCLPTDHQSRQRFAE